MDDFDRSQQGTVSSDASMVGSTWFMQLQEHFDYCHHPLGKSVTISSTFSLPFPSSSRAMSRAKCQRPSLPIRRRLARKVKNRPEIWFLGLIPAT